MKFPGDVTATINIARTGGHLARMSLLGTAGATDSGPGDPDLKGAAAHVASTSAFEMALAFDLPSPCSGKVSAPVCASCSLTV